MAEWKGPKTRLSMLSNRTDAERMRINNNTEKKKEKKNRNEKKKKALNDAALTESTVHHGAVHTILLQANIFLQTYRYNGRTIVYPVMFGRMLAIFFTFSFSFFSNFEMPRIRINHQVVLLPFHFRIAKCHFCRYSLRFFVWLLFLSLCFFLLSFCLFVRFLHSASPADINWIQ